MEEHVDFFMPGMTKEAAFDIYKRLMPGYGWRPTPPFGMEGGMTLENAKAWQLALSWRDFPLKPHDPTKETTFYFDSKVAGGRGAGVAIWIVTPIR